MKKKANGRVSRDESFSFGHDQETIRFWRDLARQGTRSHETPLYLFSIEPIHQALAELEVLDPGLPVRHWLSCKTQPIPPLLRWWRQQGMNIEVVSEFEFLAARREGFPLDRILVNGPAKHHWLPRHAARGLFVNFDSATEATTLLPLAKKLDWRVGVRCLTDEECDPEDPRFPTQFGLAPDEAVALLRKLKRRGVQLETIHLHLRTNVASAAVYERALGHLAEICRTANFQPKFVDAGGGFPPPNTLPLKQPTPNPSREGSITADAQQQFPSREGLGVGSGAQGAHEVRSGLSRDVRRFDAEFSLVELAKVYRRALKQFPGAQELWLENGRFISARSGALVVTILDIKESRGLRQLICDGGRTLNALVSNWEAHEIISLPERRGPKCLTSVCGPTCMAFDQLVRRPLPRSLRAGDRLLWLDAGAYHVPWETRFSHGYASVVWHDGKRLELIRRRETFESWWGQWNRAR